MNTDPIADFLTRIRNAQKANHRVIEIPASNLKKRITEILFDQGFILNFKFEDSENGFRSARDAGLRTIVTVNEYTHDHDFSGALLVLDHLGEPHQPLHVISGNARDTTAASSIQSSTALTHPVAAYVSVDLLRSL